VALFAEPDADVPARLDLLAVRDADTDLLARQILVLRERAFSLS